MSNYNISIDWDAAQSMLRTFLKEDIDSLKTDINNLQRLKSEGLLQNFHNEDLEYNMEVLPALIKVYNYYSAPQDHIDE